MPTRRDISMQRAVWIRIILNIKTQGNSSAQEGLTATEHTELISQRAAAIAIAVHRLYAPTAAANVWAETLFLAVKEGLSNAKEKNFF